MEKLQQYFTSLETPAEREERLQALLKQGWKVLGWKEVPATVNDGRPSAWMCTLTKED